MTPRFQAALVQLAAFVVGGIVAPMGHLARHRPDHTHGGDGATLALTLPADHGSESHSHGQSDGSLSPLHLHPGLREPHAHGVEAHGHSHGRIEDVAHEHEAHGQWRGGGHDDGQATPALPLDHGHGSISHFGLALIGTAPPLPLPRPERREVLHEAARIAEARLLEPSFPLPRPPPHPPRTS